MTIGDEGVASICMGKKHVGNPCRNCGHEEVPAVGLPVKLRKGSLQLSARQIQHVTKIRKLEIGKHNIDTQSELDAEGGYWIQTTHTGSEWWAWSLFRVA